MVENRFRSIWQNRGEDLLVFELDRFHTVEYVFAPWEWVSHWCNSGQEAAWRESVDAGSIKLGLVGQAVEEGGQT
jgi:hypothetical protein